MNLHLLMESQVATLTDLTLCFYLVQQLQNSCAFIDRSYCLREYRLTMQIAHLLCGGSAVLCETRNYQSNINNNLDCYF